MSDLKAYRGRIAPTPTGHLHLGHARTFWVAQERARQCAGRLILRNEDLDQDRCKPQFARDMIEDLRWFGFTWDEGPDVGGPHAPYNQSERLAWYAEIWRALHAAGVIYPSAHTRKDVQAALTAPHDEDAEPLFPRELRPHPDAAREFTEPTGVNWRFRVPDGRAMTFCDGNFGIVSRTAGVEFGDFLVWRKDGFPSYELAVVADDHAMQVSEVVRGADLLTSTARQLLLYDALQWQPPAFFHCPLMKDERGVRLAKRSAALSLRTLREHGRTPEELRRDGRFSDCNVR
jgi:glutamyl-tRNA synthetase